MAPPKRRQPKKRGPTNKGSRFCFTIMPYGGWHDTYYKSIFVPAIEGAGLEARRADDIYRPSSIIHDIWDLTQRATVLLADLTGRNPNVLYELGLAHAIQKPVVMVADTMDAIPFDLRGLRILIYDRNEPEWGRSLQRNITNSLSEVLAAPTSAVPPAFLKVRPEPPKPVTAHEREILQLRSDIDALKAQVARRERRFSDPYMLGNFAPLGLPLGTYEEPALTVRYTGAAPTPADFAEAVRRQAGVTTFEPPPQPPTSKPPAAPQSPSSGPGGGPKGGS